MELVSNSWEETSEEADRSMVEGAVKMLSVAVAERVLDEVGAADEMSASEAEWVERVRQGDRSAFEWLVMRYQPNIYGLLYRLIGDAEEARDLAQETFLRVYQKIDQFRGEASLKTWIYRIALRQAANHRRWWQRRGRDRMVSLDGPQNGQQRAVIDTLPDKGPNSEQVLIDRERQRRLEWALRQVKPSYRVAVILRDVEGCSYEEIAHILRISIGTVKSRIARGRERLRQVLCEDALEVEDD
ncbi:MAG: sigma-70 family RNA polymerase sigma factor [Acidobacteria bacterium]|nr:MAG: sigma-70 family RNA polymerase sigma factor [Acidobacteriota bacterium]